jgi:sporulation protein YlmC with PRC-barrel domain
VVDKDGEDLGEVDDLFLDEQETKIRFLEVASGGFLGLGKTKFLVPVEAIIRLAADTVYIIETRQHVAGTPPYDPDLINQEVGEGSYYGNVYRHYGYPPYWGPDYIYPPYPHYRSGV